MYKQVIVVIMVLKRYLLLPILLWVMLPYCCMAIVKQAIAWKAGMVLILAQLTLTKYNSVVMFAIAKMIMKLASAITTPILTILEHQRYRWILNTLKVTVLHLMVLLT